jgi:hypothetical protein
MSALTHVSWTNCSAFTIGFAGKLNWNSWSLVTTNRLAVAISTSLFVRLLNIELEFGAMKGDRGSDSDAGEKRSSLAAAMITIGWRQRVPDEEGSFSRMEMVWMAREMRNSSGGWDMETGNKSKVCWLP